METEKMSKLQQRSIEREQVRLEQFNAIDEGEVLQLPNSVLGKLVEAGILVSANPETEKDTSEYLLKKGDQGHFFVMASVTSKESYSVSGVFLQGIADDVIGSTSFAAQLRGEEKIVAVESTHTEKDFQGKGLGQQRLIVINEYCKSRFGKPLSSIDTRSRVAEIMWQKLIDKGLAERKILSNSEEIYSML